jgi:YesN/AraC family two-component response regulator
LITDLITDLIIDLINGLINDMNKDLNINLINGMINDMNKDLNKDLNINQVSVALAIPSRELSYIINNHFGQRFNDFLNKYSFLFFVE